MEWNTPQQLLQACVGNTVYVPNAKALWLPEVLITPDLELLALLQLRIGFQDQGRSHMRQTVS